jgi:iron complex outermembrane recepter protein
LKAGFGILASLATILSAVPTALGQGPATAPAEASPVVDEAAESPDKLQNIDLLNMEVPVVITAARHEQKITAVPYAISVITAEDIRQSGARSVPDALRLVPGVDVADLSINNSAVGIRGLQGILSREVLVLVDGRQVFDSVFGGSLWGNWPFELEDIARIEVIRGPGGTTWGANAVNGVINIITKDPKDQLGLTNTSGGGSRGTWKEHLGYAFQQGKLRMNVSGEYAASDGFNEGGSILRNVEDDVKTGRTNVHTIFDATPKDQIMLSGGNALVDGGWPQTPLASFMRNSNAGSQASYIQSRWSHEIAADNRFELNAYVNDYQGMPAYDAIDYRYEQFAIQFSHTFKPAEHHTLTWGIDTRADILNTSTSDPQLLSQGFLSTGIVGLYVQDEWAFAPRWRFTLGGRIDYECYGGFQPSGRAALSYDLSESSMIYGAVSRAFQMPPVGFRFVDLPFAEGLGWFTSEEDVRSEQLIAYELGYRGEFFDRLQTNINLYCHDYSSMTILDLMTGPPGLLRYNFTNGYSAVGYGLETDAKWAVTKQLTLLANYTLELLDCSGRSSIVQTDYMTPPTNKFMVGTRYNPIDPLHLSASLYFVDDVNSPNPTFPLVRLNVPESFRLDLRAEYEFWKDKASVAVGVRDLLTPNHLEGTSLFQNVAEVPRMVYAEVRLVLK